FLQPNSKHTRTPPAALCPTPNSVCVPFAEFQIKRSAANHNANALPRTIIPSAFAAINDGSVLRMYV
ncbi:unnamed protein product, partial [Ceratitis capitata]